MNYDYSLHPKTGKDTTRYMAFILGLRKAQFVELGRWLKEAFLASLAYFCGLPGWLP